MNGIAALWYLDSRRFSHGIAGIVKKPARLVMWLAIVLYFGLQSFLSRSRPHPFSFLPALDNRLASGVTGAALAVAFIVLWHTAKNGRIHTATKPIDALFLSRAAIPPSVVAAWLYGRYFLLTYGRSVFAITYLSLVAHALSGAITFAGAGLFLTLEMIRIPIASIGRTRRWLAPTFAALACACALAALASLFGRDLGLGAGLLLLLHGNMMAIVTVYAFAVLAAIAGWLSARDMYPEMYLVSTFRALVAKRRLGGNAIDFVSRGAQRPTKSGNTFLRGPWVEIWKQLAFLRRAHGPVLACSVIVASAACGIGAGIAERHFHGGALSVLGMLVMLCAFVLTFTSVSLGLDLAKPLWWLGMGSTFDKLLAWAIGSSLPISCIIAIAALAEAVTAGPRVLPAFLIGAIVLPAPMRGIGAMIYSFFPSRIDQRGPAMMLRMLVIYVALILSGAAGSAVALASGSLFAGLYAGMVVFALEGSLALAVTARRINGRGVELALSE